MFWAVVLSGLVISANGPQPKRVEVLGIYGDPSTFWRRGGRLSDLGVNAVFAHHGLGAEQAERAHREGACVFAEFGVFRNRRLANQRPELWPIGPDGRPIPPTERFLGLCPTNEQYNEEKLEELRSLVRERELMGVWLDYLHFHSDFELPDPPLVQSCFNDSCLARFEAETGIRPQGNFRADKAKWILTNHGQAWTDWKCSVITDFARRAREVIDAERPGMLLGIYSCPWTDEEYDGAMRRIVGEDLADLAQYVDVFSPMVYHGNCERPADWPEAYTRWLRRKLDGVRPGCRIWPIVQGGGTPSHRPPVTPEGFRTALEGAFRGGGTGVMFYHFAAVAREEAKLRVLGTVYNGLADARQAGSKSSAVQAERLAAVRNAMHQGRYAAAAEQCRRVLREDGTFAEAWDLMGQIDRKTGREAQATSCFRRAAFERGESPRGIDEI